MNEFLAQSARRIFTVAAIFTLGLAAIGAAQADPVSISPSGNVPAQSTLSVTWTPATQLSNASIFVVQMAANGPTVLNNTMVFSSNSGHGQITLPAGLSCGPTHSYAISTVMFTPNIAIIVTNEVPQSLYSANFTIKCPLGHVTLPSSVYAAPARTIDGKVGCPTGEQLVNGKCVALRDIDKAVPQTKAN